jgi:hypothetical protein
MLNLVEVLKRRGGVAELDFEGDAMDRYVRRPEHD